MALAERFRAPSETRRERVLILIKGLGRGGAEQLIANAAPYFDHETFEYEVAYLLPWKDALVPDLEAAGLTVHCLDGGRGLGWVGRLRALVRDRDIDLVHVHSPFVAVGTRVALRNASLPIVYTEHNGWDRYHRATYWANAATYAANAHVFAVSDQVRRSIEYPRGLRFRALPPRETLYHGPDPAVTATWSDADRTAVRSELGIALDAPVVGTIANFKEHKGYPYLLQAAARVLERVPETRFVTVGQGPLEDEMKALADELGIAQAFSFTGFREDVPRLASSFDLFVLSSIHEGLSIALLEAMTLGIPAVVTSVGGLPEVVEHGREGYLVRPRDPDALADHMTELLLDAAKRGRMGKRARERAAAFDIRNSVRRAETIYAELLS